jgi:hypothetical protein
VKLVGGWEARRLGGWEAKEKKKLIAHSKG